MNRLKWRPRPELTPKKITPLIMRFCQDVCPGSRPYYVATAEVAGTRVNRCFDNCDVAAQAFGGKSLYGWDITIVSGHHLTAEFHAIWEHDGQRACITPHSRSRSRILFLPDPARGERLVRDLDVPATMFRRLKTFAGDDAIVYGSLEEFYAGQICEI